METRIRRFNKEKVNLPMIKENDKYEDMIISNGVTLTLPSNYPFTPPLLKVNNIQYIRYLETEFKKVKPFLTQYKISPYNCCLCCSSVTGDNWTPCYGIKEVLNEYNKYNELLQMIHKTILYLNELNMDDLIHYTIAQYLF
jgi:ubiquitin-protein ligase